MPTPNKRSDFFESEEGKEVKEKLQLMTKSSLYNTAPSYTPNAFQYPDNLIPFTDKHMNYINTHPKMDLEMYLSNLRIMTRVR